MFEMAVTDSFEASHHLPNYNGKCKNVHGHSWNVTAIWQGTKQDKCGICMDLTILKRNLRNICGDFDHTSLNTPRTFTHPTAENIARKVFERLTHAEFGAGLVKVIVEETRGCSVAYFTRSENTRNVS